MEDHYQGALRAERADRPRGGGPAEHQVEELLREGHVLALDGAEEGARGGVRWWELLCRRRVKPQSTSPPPPHREGDGDRNIGRRDGLLLREDDADVRLVLRRDEP